LPGPYGIAVRKNFKSDRHFNFQHPHPRLLAWPPSRLLPLSLCQEKNIFLFFTGYIFSLTSPAIEIKFELLP